MTFRERHMPDLPIKSRKGFASMDPARRRAIASLGGKAAHQKGSAHQWTADEAKAAGRKGGAASHRKPPSKSDPQP